MNNKNVKVYVVSHSEKDIKQIKADDVYTPLFVGRNGRENFGFLSDDQGDNISSKNPNYCELTGLYWMWKQSEADIIGLCHYRRYLKSDNGNLLTKEDILTYLDEYDIILPKKIELVKKSYQETYKDTYFIEALDITRETIKDLYPEYIDSYDKVLSQSEFSNFNMFISPKELITSYCDWVFTILEELEKKIDIEKFQRGYGLISETIFNVWIEHNNLKVKYCDVRYIGNKLKLRMFLSNIKILRKLYRYMYFKLFKNSKGEKIEKKIIDFFY